MILCFKLNIMKKQLRLKYKWIKQRRCDVLQFLEEEFWIEKNTNSKTTIEAGLGITGDDAAELIEKFEKRFHCNLKELDFDKHFYSEAEATGNISLLFSILLLKIILLPVALMVLPFSLNKFKEIMAYTPPSIQDSIKKDLTVGDLITSSFTHKLILRNEVLIKLV